MDDPTSEECIGFVLHSLLWLRGFSPRVTTLPLQNRAAISPLQNLHTKHFSQLETPNCELENPLRLHSNPPSIR